MHGRGTMASKPRRWSGVNVMPVGWAKAADRWDESQQFLADTFGK